MNAKHKHFQSPCFTLSVVVIVVAHVAHGVPASCRPVLGAQALETVLLVEPFAQADLILCVIKRFLTGGIWLVAISICPQVSALEDYIWDRLRPWRPAVQQLRLG